MAATLDHAPNAGRCVYERGARESRHQSSAMAATVDLEPYAARRRPAAPRRAAAVQRKKMMRGAMRQDLDRTNRADLPGRTRSSRATEPGKSPSTVVSSTLTRKPIITREDLHMTRTLPAVYENG